MKNFLISTGFLLLIQAARQAVSQYPEVAACSVLCPDFIPSVPHPGILRGRDLTWPQSTKPSTKFPWPNQAPSGYEIILRGWGGDSGWPDNRNKPAPPRASPQTGNYPDFNQPAPILTRPACSSLLCPVGGNEGYGYGQNPGTYQGPNSGCGSLLCPSNPSPGVYGGYYNNGYGYG